MNEFKITRYLFRDKVDLILIMVCIAFLIKDFYANAWCGIMILYIMGVMWRMGTAMDNLNEYVTVESLRRKLKLYPVVGEWPRRKRTIFAMIVDFIFWAGLITILVFYVLR